MAFVGIRGVAGRVFVPRQESASRKKHACRDCFSCQMCSDDRCSRCLKTQAKARAQCRRRRS